MTDHTKNQLARNAVKALESLISYMRMEHDDVVGDDEEAFWKRFDLNNDLHNLEYEVMKINKYHIK